MTDYSALVNEYGFLSRRLLEDLTYALKHRAIERDWLVGQIDRLDQLAAELAPLEAKNQEQERERLAAIKARVKSEWLERYGEERQARWELCERHKVEQIERLQREGI